MKDFYKHFILACRQNIFNIYMKTKKFQMTSRIVNVRHTAVRQVTSKIDKMLSKGETMRSDDSAVSLIRFITNILYSQFWFRSRPIV